jgi:NADPH:quinone reductase-like Zn-dependent oxidoreductase
MSAVLLTGHGGLEKLEYRTDMQVPRPKAGEVLIEAAAAGVNNTDIRRSAAGRLSHLSPGSDQAGAAGLPQEGTHRQAGPGPTGPEHLNT